MFEQDQEINMEYTLRSIYRYKFTPEFMEFLHEFSKIHQYDNRHDFKEAWAKWIEENDEYIHKEITRLSDIGYRGDILGKMFISARYYFRKKPLKKPDSKPRQSYTGVNKPLLESMERYIKNSNFQKPSLSFLAYCRENQEIIKEEIAAFMKKGIKEKDEIQNKIKKTYKNRYFQIYNKTNK